MIFAVLEDVAPRVSIACTLSLRVTKDKHDKKLQQLKDQQYRLDLEAEEHTQADHDYKLTVSGVFSISRRAGEYLHSF